MVLRWLKLATRCINQATLKILFKSVVGTFYASCCRSGSAVRCRLSWRYWNNVEWTWFVSLRDCLCYLLTWTELSLLFTRCRTYDTDYFPIGMGRAVMCYPADFLMINIKITIAPLVRLLACFYYNSLVCTSAIHSCCSFYIGLSFLTLCGIMRHMRLTSSSQKALYSVVHRNQRNTVVLISDTNV